MIKNFVVPLQRVKKIEESPLRLPQGGVKAAHRGGANEALPLGGVGGGSQLFNFKSFYYGN